MPDTPGPTSKPATNASQLSIGHTERAAQDTTDPRARREAEMAEQEKKLEQAANASSGAGEKSLEERITAVLKQIYDPEIPVSIYDLGLIYGIDIDDQNNATVTMTLTTPACPVAQDLPEQVRAAVGRVRDVNEAHVELTFDPPWTQDNLSEEARIELGLM